MKIGVNIFSIRNELVKNNAKVWQEIKTAGFDSIEPLVYANEENALQNVEENKREGIKAYISKFIFSYSQAEALAQKLKVLGLAVDCMHIMLTDKDRVNPQKYAQELVEFGKKVGVTNFVVGSPDFLTDVKEAVTTINVIADYLNSHKMKLIYHAHDAEWSNYGDSTFMDYLLTECSNLWFEPDVGWIYYAGKNVCEVLRKYVGRIAFIHLKDLVVNQGKPVFTAVGYGDVPMKKVLQFARNNGFLDKMIIDQDESTDIVKDLYKAKKYISNNI